MNEGGLGDVRVVEMGQLLAGPFCGQLLGDFGAEVIKVEPPGTGDPMREWGREKPHGQSGPYAARAGFGSIAEAMGGIRYVTGDPDKPPSRAGISLGDELAGTFAALGTLVALHARERTGRGQIVDAALYEAVLALMESLLPEWEVAGYQRERTGSVLPNVAPSNVYPTMDGPVLIAANQDAVFRRLTAVMGRPELADDELYATHGARGANAARLDRLISDWTQPQAAAVLLELLHENGIPAGLIYRAADMLNDPHFAARDAIIRMMHPEFGEIPMQNVVPRLSATPGAVRSLGPELGQHNEEIYAGTLKLTSEQISALAAGGII